MAIGIDDWRWCKVFCSHTISNLLASTARAGIGQHWRRQVCCVLADSWHTTRPVRRRLTSAVLLDIDLWKIGCSHSFRWSRQWSTHVVGSTLHIVLPPNTKARPTFRVPSAWIAIQFDLHHSVDRTVSGNTKTTAPISLLAEHFELAPHVPVDPNSYIYHVTPNKVSRSPEQGDAIPVRPKRQAAETSLCHEA